MNKKNNKGFTLIELSIVLIVLGFMTTLSINMTSGYINYRKSEETKIKIEAIKSAIKNYITINKKLPCPANIKINYSDNNPVASCSVNIRKINGFLIGTIPTETLQINKLNVFDAWQNKFVYIVPEDYTNEININNDLIDNKFIYAIISAGKNRNSVYPYKSTTIKNKKTTESDYKNSYDGFENTIIFENVDDIIYAESVPNMIYSIDFFDIGCSIVDNDIRGNINATCGSNYFKTAINKQMNYAEKLNSPEVIYTTKTITMPDGSSKDIYTDYKECIIECTKFGRPIIYINKVNI